MWGRCFAACLVYVPVIIVYDDIKVYSCNFFGSVCGDLLPFLDLWGRELHTLDGVFEDFPTLNAKLHTGVQIVVRFLCGGVGFFADYRVYHFLNIVWGQGVYLDMTDSREYLIFERLLHTVVWAWFQTGLLYFFEPMGHIRWYRHFLDVGYIVSCSFGDKILCFSADLCRSSSVNRFSHVCRYGYLLLIVTVFTLFYFGKFSWHWVLLSVSEHRCYAPILYQPMIKDLPA